MGGRHAPGNLKLYWCGVLQVPKLTPRDLTHTCCCRLLPHDSAVPMLIGALRIGNFWINAPTCASSFAKLGPPQSTLLSRFCVRVSAALVTRPSLLVTTRRRGLSGESERQWRRTLVSQRGEAPPSVSHAAWLYCPRHGLGMQRAAAISHAQDA